MGKIIRTLAVCYLIGSLSGIRRSSAFKIQEPDFQQDDGTNELEEMWENPGEDGSDEGPVVQTLYGTVRGMSALDRLNRSYDGFLGVPFARPPVGALRWQPAQVPEPWGGVRNASEYSAHCIQVIARAWFFLGMGGRDSEDCLYLNIYVPGSVQQALTSPLPVIVYYYGGAMVLGTAEMYPGQELANTGDVIVVTPNYRVSVMGFFSTGDAAAPGNYGLWDAKASLDWIEANIGYFGGDPGRITVMGQSAGSTIASFMMLTPETNKVFQRSIPVSGATYYYDNLKPSAEHLARHFGCNTTDSQEIVDCLLQEDAKELDDIFYRQWGNDTNSYSFNVVIDGTFVTQDPVISMQQGLGSHIDMLTGYTHHDSAGFVIGNPIALPLNRSSEEWNKDNQQLYEDWLRYFSSSEDPDYVIDVLYERYPAMNDSDPAVATEAVSRVRSDFEFASRAFQQVHYHAASEGQGSSYFYEFSHRQTFLEAYPAWVNGSHLDDVYSFLGETYFAFYRDVYLRGAEYSPEDKIVSEIVMNYYANFAHTGDPNQGPHEVGVSWPEYDPSGRLYLVESPTPVVRVVSQEKAEEYLWFINNLTDIAAPATHQFFDTVIRGDTSGEQILEGLEEES